MMRAGTGLATTGGDMSAHVVVPRLIRRAGSRGLPGPNLLAGALLTLFIVGCAAGDPRFTADAPAGFWVGLWHGMISWVTLVIGIFSDQVAVYEVHNRGGLYDLGFLLGIGCLAGGGSRSYQRKLPTRSKAEQKEWEEIAKKVEHKLQRKIRQWAESEPDEAWEVVGSKAEAKLKQRLRAWAEEGEEATTQR